MNYFMKNVFEIMFRWCLTYDAVYIYNGNADQTISNVFRVGPISKERKSYIDIVSFARMPCTEKHKQHSQRDVYILQAYFSRILHVT